MKSTRNRRFSLALVVLLFTYSLASCSGEASGADTSFESTAADTSTTEVETPEKLAEELYGEKDYGKREFRILAMDVGKHFYSQVGSDYNEIWADDENGEIMNDAIYKRNLSAEELINIKVTPVFVGDTGEVTSTAQKSVMAGANDFDAIFNRMDYLGTLMEAGCLANLISIDAIDTSHAWWDANIVDNFTLFGKKLYWISGDYNTLDDYAAEAIFFNKELCDDNNLVYPYASVRDGSWTIDEFYAMAKAAERDLDGDGKLTVGSDIVGHQENNDQIKHWIYAMGEKAIEINADKTLEIMTLHQRQIDVIDKLYSLMVEGGMSYTGTYDTFSTGNALFQGVMLGNINSFRDMRQDFGVVPMPKYNTEQTNYGGYVSNGWTTALAIPMNAADREFSGVCFEVLSAYSTNTVRTALYDVLLTNKLIRDEESIEMIEIIFANKSYDWAVDFTWGSSFGSTYNAVYTNKNNSFVSSATSILPSQTNTLNKLLDVIEGLPD